MLKLNPLVGEGRGEGETRGGIVAYDASSTLTIRPRRGEEFRVFGQA